MTNRRAKIAAGATVVGLAALGGVALGTNPGTPVSQQVAGSGSGAAVVTSASGATTTLPTTQTVAAHTKRAPIVTRASGGGLTPTED